MFAHSVRLAALLSLVSGLAQAQDPLLGADSVVLERTACYGTCPAYRLRVARSGSILFESRNRGDEGRRVTDSIPPLNFQWILNVAMLADFLDLPDRIEGDARFCPHVATDHPTATVAIFLPRQTKQVVDYYGCFWAPVALRELEDFIDSVTGASLWIRPNPVR